MSVEAQSVDQVLVSRNVPAGSSKRFRERPHQDVDVTGVNVKIVVNTAAMGTKRADGMSFINENIELEY